MLDSLGAAILVPMLQSNAMAATLCLGPNRSGDIYTTTDLTLLAAVAGRVSAELTRFDEAEIARQIRAMRDSLRRYVPEQIASHVLSGQNLEARECDVSVFSLTYALIPPMPKGNLPRRFSTVNLYT